MSAAAAFVVGLIVGYVAGLLLGGLLTLALCRAVAPAPIESDRP